MFDFSPRRFRCRTGVVGSIDKNSGVQFDHDAGALGAFRARSHTYRSRSLPALDGRADFVAIKIPCMGTNTRRFQPSGLDNETLARYKSGAFALLAECQTPGCGHARRMVIAMLIRRCCKGEETTLGEVRPRLRCHKCGKKRAALKAFDGGHSRDGR